MGIIKGLIGLALLALGFCVFVNVGNVPRRNMMEPLNKANGERLVIGLTAFHKATGHFPKALNELQPRFVKTVPRVNEGDREFGYDLEDGGKAFTLTYPEMAMGALPSDGEYVYDSRQDAWEHVLH